MIIDPTNYFYVCNGSIIKNKEELLECLKKIEVQEFLHHVNKEKNDFSNWINDILDDKKLAQKIKKLKTRKSIEKAVAESIKNDVTTEKKKKAFSKDKKKIISQIKGAIKDA